MALSRYGELRNQLMRESFPSVFAPVVVRDADSNYLPIPISERLVQCIWYDQRVTRDSLRTTDGRRVRVVFPGRWNLEAGPDFHNATLQIGDQPEATGDVEIHLRADDWFHHRHERDPKYNNVILHAVLWQAGSQSVPLTRGGDSPPQLVLQHQLDASLETLHDEIDLDAYPYGAGTHGRRCAELLMRFPDDTVQEMLSSAGDERLAIKARKFARWIHRSGAEQSFYEGWMEALGYKANKVPFRELARRLPLAALAGRRLELPALLFGIANLLPTSAMKCRNTTGQQYVKRLWNTWWRLRPDFEDTILPAGIWRLHGIRPANHPHRRIGAALALLARRGNLLGETLEAIETGKDPARLFAKVQDEYWSRHFTLGGRTQPRSTELIGEERARAIVANIALPLALAYAEGTGNERLALAARNRYASLPAQSSNSLLRLAAHQILGTPARIRALVRTANHQQGLMQIFQDFCINDKSACRNCKLPELVQRWNR